MEDSAFALYFIHTLGDLTGDWMPLELTDVLFS